MEGKTIRPVGEGQVARFQGGGSIPEVHLPGFRDGVLHGGGQELLEAGR